MTNWVPISGSALQFSKNASGAAAADYYLKFYAAGTTTAIAMATTSSGATTLDKCKIDATGWAVNGSDDPFIPHIDRDYKLVLYTNATDADNDATGSAVWVIDNLSAEGLDKSYTSVASLRDSTGNDAFNVIEIESYYEITYPSTAGPKGGHRRHRTGGTNASPTVGSPVAVSTIGTGTQAGYVWDGDGVEWFISGKVGETTMLGAKEDAITDDTTAITDALTVFNVVKQTGHSVCTEINIPADTTFACAAGEITYNPTATGLFCLNVVGNNVEVIGPTITNTAARQSGGVSQIDTFSGTGSIKADSVSNITVHGANVSEGSHAIVFDNVTKSKIINSRATDQESWAYVLIGCNGVTVHNNYGSGCATDCFKFREQSENMVVTSNIAENNFSDGFDLFDGFFKSVLDGNIARNNTNYGFECKGTPSVDYNFRDSVVSNNIAYDNGSQGFSVVSIRHCTFSGNLATENGGDGFLYDGVQGCTCTAESASKNEGNGFKLGVSSDVSRNVWSACVAIDNSQTVTYNVGFDLTATADGNDFIGCRALNGTGGDAGNQRYGMKFATGSAGNKIIGGSFDPNDTASFNGDVGAQFIVQAAVAGGFDTRNFTLGTHVSTTDTAITGYINVRGTDGLTYKAAVIT